MTPENIKRLNSALRLAEKNTILDNEGKEITFSIKAETLSTLNLILNHTIQSVSLATTKHVYILASEKISDLYSYIQEVPRELQVQESYVREVQLIVNLIGQIIKKGEANEN